MLHTLGAASNDYITARLIADIDFILRLGTQPLRHLHPMGEKVVSRQGADCRGIRGGQPRLRRISAPRVTF
jgi:hypothetical protein